MAGSLTEISLQLNRVLDRYGLSSTFLDYRRTVMNHMSIFFNDDSTIDTILVVGSKRDALCSINDTTSDLDVIGIQSAAIFDETNLESAKQFISNTPHFKDNVFILESSSRFGYKYLKSLIYGNSKDFSYTKVKGSTYLLNTSKEDVWSERVEHEVEVHGPALSTKWSGYDEEDFQLDTDAVIAFQCPCLPSDFDEWCNRSRNYNWPPHWIIEITKKQGCFVVAAGHPASDTQPIEWRLSLPKTEYLLTKSFNHVQMKCYVLMKLVLKWVIQPQMQEPLSSYHIKTVMFWMSEERDRNFWRPDNLVDCFIFSFMKLKTFVENKTCPNYLLTGLNLFEGKLDGDIHKRLIDILDNLLTEGFAVVYQCLPLNKYLNGSKCSHLNNTPCVCLEKHLLNQRLNEFRFNETSIKDDIRTDASREDIYQICQNVCVDWHVINEIRNESILYSYAFTSISVCEELGLPNKSFYKLQKKYVSQLCMSGDVAQLKLATLLYDRRRLGYIIPLLSFLINTMESNRDLEVCSEGGARVAGDIVEIEGVECIYLTQNNKGFRVSEIVFNPCDKRLIPPDLQNEMGKPKNVNGIRYEGWVFVDSIVYAYYLLIVALHDMRRYSGITSWFRRFGEVCLQRPGTIRIFRKDMAFRLYDHAFTLVCVATKGFTKFS